MVEDSEIFDSIECEEMEDGSLVLHISKNVTEKIVQTVIENALYELVREKQEA
jgi:hypothetical protein